MKVIYEGKGSIDVCNRIIASMDLDEQILKNIYWRNALRFIGEK